ncbi:MAG: hypothetical protein IT435_01650 [Phycisphaerales bacterium]|nr:hypothetical protein [Phycisphaerales bacterium]
MNPKSAKKGSPVAPAEPDPPVVPEEHEAGSAAPPEAQAAQKKPHKPLNQTAGGAGSGEEGEGNDEPLSWIEIEMIDEADQPVTGMCYSIELPDGTVAEGVLDEKGMARVEGFVKGSGQCKVSFPDLDKEAWEKV